MDQPSYRIVFSGDCAPTMSAEAVRQNLAALFRIDESRLRGLFDGRSKVLRKGLGAEHARRYLAALHRAGALARLEEEPPSAAPQAQRVDAEPSPAPVAPRMTCPKCQAEQAYASQCSHCSIVIDKYLARQAARLQAETESPYAPPRTPLADPSTGPAELKVFSLSGRIGRLRYLAWSMVALAAVSAAFLLASLLLGLLAPTGIGAMLLILVTAGVVNVQIGVQRLHDIGLSGWLMALHFVPVLGSLMPLALAAVPGKREANRFGAPPPPNGTSVKLLAALWLLVLAGAFVFGMLAR